MSRRPKRLDYNHGIEYLDMNITGIFFKQKNYSTIEVKNIFDCSYETIRSLIRKGHLEAIKDINRNYRITHKSLIDFLINRSSGIQRNIEEVIFEGLTAPRGIAEHLKCTTMNVDDRIRLKNIPRINISASQYPEKKPYYRLPKKETREILENLKREQ